MFGTFREQMVIERRTLAIVNILVAVIAAFEKKRSHRFRRINIRSRVILLKPTRYD